MRTSVLDRFTPELCDAVIGREDSAAVVAHSAGQIVPGRLERPGEWYRYHHLFGELLRLELGLEETHSVRRRAMAWCRAHGHIEDAIEYAAAGGEAKLVAQLLVEHDRELVWGGGTGSSFAGYVASIGTAHRAPVAAPHGAAAASLLGAPEVEIQRLLTVAERSRRERPELWSPYAETIAEVTRANGLSRGDVGGAVGHGRHAVAAARQSGADVLAVGVLAALSQALYSPVISMRLGAWRSTPPNSPMAPASQRATSDPGAARPDRCRAGAKRKRASLGSSGD